MFELFSSVRPQKLKQFYFPAQDFMTWSQSWPAASRPSSTATSSTYTSPKYSRARGFSCQLKPQTAWRLKFWPIKIVLQHHQRFWTFVSSSNFFCSWVAPKILSTSFKQRSSFWDGSWGLFRVAIAWFAFAKASFLSQVCHVELV